MPKSIRFRWLVLVAMSPALWLLVPTDVAAADGAKRTLWTTSRVHGSPDPPSPYRTEVAFTNLKFDEPLSMARVPGSDRLAIAERWGKVFVFDNQRGADKKQLLVDVDRMVIGLAFHPNFQKNGRFFVTMVMDAKAGPSEIRVSEYKRATRNPLRASADSEIPVISWTAEGHRGGCLRFGPDGYLYIASGDGSGIADGLKTGQNIGDLKASILRIDVDHPQKGRPYGIPADNPFVKTEGARGEVWAYGLRQAWKFSFDKPTGRLWAGEVGQDLWESIHLIKRGGNYGWSVVEGTHPFRPQRKKGPTPIQKPVVEHPHSDFRSITGGYVYHGSRLKRLQGAYVYGDYDTGKVWAFRWNGEKATDHRELVDTQYRLVGFGQDNEGEVFLLDHIGGRIHRLTPAPPLSPNAPTFPRKLSETGLFASTKDHRPAPGLIPYSVNAPLWADGAEKDRFIALPGDTTIEFNAVPYPQPAPGAQPGWRFPDGTVLVKTFSLEMEVGNPDSLRRLETRLLHHERLAGGDEMGAQVWHGYTYVWNDEQTDAVLLDSKGLDRTYTIKDAAAEGGRRQQTWRFPSRAECTLCHTMAAKYVLGVNTLQLNKNHASAAGPVNQLTALERQGVFSKPLPEKPAKLPKLADYHDKGLDLDQRARSYLHANCAHCHRKWGGGNADFQLLAMQPLAESGALNERPGQGHFDLNDPRILVPGNPKRSMVLHRMQKLGLGRMPHVGSGVVDEEAVKLIREWIEQLSR